MAYSTAIEWTNTTWNPVTGCTKISAGCDNCYAERFAERFRGVKGHPFENGFDLTLRPERLDQPLRWRRPRMIFVNSMSDLFHKHVPFDYVGRVFETMERADWHVFQILTKRSSRMRDYVNARYANDQPPAHIWFGTSIEDGSKVSRVRHLSDTVACVRFLSVEPLIGPISNLDLTGIHWVIVGGESGPHARPMDPDWVRHVRDQCVACGVPFFFKQWGGLRPKSGGRSLDGREWNEWPHMADAETPQLERYGLAAQ
ncbi:MAG: phage Gp37/Gp68 family protein [Alphaproteobacteria bacterium]